MGCKFIYKQLVLLKKKIIQECIHDVPELESPKKPNFPTGQCQI